MLQKITKFSVDCHKFKATFNMQSNLDSTNTRFGIFNFKPDTLFGHKCVCVRVSVHILPPWIFILSKMMLKTYTREQPNNVVLKIWFILVHSNFVRSFSEFIMLALNTKCWPCMLPGGKKRCVIYDFALW